MAPRLSRSGVAGVETVVLRAKNPGTGEEEEIVLHTTGTFGVASAAYWWGRLSAGAAPAARASTSQR